MNEQFFADYQHATKRLLLLDYDGTLTPLKPTPEGAVPSHELRQLLIDLTRVADLECVIISGRPRETLNVWLGDIPIGFVAEHGVWQKQPHHDWSLREGLLLDWKSTIYEMMLAHSQKFPGSSVEKKHAALAYHYRALTSERAEADANVLYDELQHHESFGKNFTLLHGKKVIEAVAAGADKGIAAKAWLQNDKYDFICAIGDDTTDEALFAALPPSAYTIHVGDEKTVARFKLSHQPDVIKLLGRLLALDTRP